MASVSDLVKAVAQAEDLDVNFVSVYARSAREAGKISHFGRGKNAAKMNLADAANLIIAVNAGDLAKNAPIVIDKFRSLAISGGSVLSSAQNNSFSSIFHNNSNFGEALERILQLCLPQLNGQDLLGEAIVDGFDFPKGDIERSDLIAKIDDVISMKISFMRPAPFVLISFRDARNREVGGAMFGDRAALNSIERLITTTITQKTTRSVGLTISR